MKQEDAKNGIADRAEANDAVHFKRADAKLWYASM
jgi:hypothetical protein